MIAIIAILASMLMPALSKAREKARAITCVNNLKHTMLMNIMYADDSDGYMPAPGYSSKNTYGWSWPAYTYWAQALVIYSSGLNYNDSSVQSNGAGKGLYKIYSCPVAPNAVNVASNFQTYGMNRRLKASGDSLWEHMKLEEMVEDANAFFPRPATSNILIFADSLMRTGNTISGQQAQTAPWSTETAWVTRHGNKCNVAFADGHAAGLTYGELRDNCRINTRTATVCNSFGDYY